MTRPLPVVFLPGILMPATMRYAPLRAELGDERPTLTKELAIYAGPEPPAGYTIEHEVEDLDRFAAEHGLDRFHLYGHSGGGAVALAYTAVYPDSVASLALDEPASDFTDDDRRAIDERIPPIFSSLPVPERMAMFAASLVRDGVEVPELKLPEGNPEMDKRPAGVAAFRDSLIDFSLDRQALAAYRGPVYFSYGGLSNERWEAMADRLQRELPRCTVERYEGIHHLNTSHQAEPARVAEALRKMWSEAESAEAH